MISSLTKSIQEKSFLFTYLLSLHRKAACEQCKHKIVENMLLFSFYAIFGSLQC